MLLGRVQGLMDDCPSTRDGTASRPPSTRPQPQPLPGSRPPTSHNRPASNRPASGRPTTRPLTGSTMAGSPAAPGSNDKAAPSMALRLTTGRTEGKMSAIDRFLSGTGGMKPSVAAPEAVQTLRLYDEGRRMAEVATNDENAAGQERDPANPCAAMSKPGRLSLRPAGPPEASFSIFQRQIMPVQAAPSFGQPRPISRLLSTHRRAVKHVRYVGRQTATGQIQRLKRNDNARAAQCSVAGVVFGGD